MMCIGREERMLCERRPSRLLQRHVTKDVHRKDQRAKFISNLRASQSARGVQL